MIVSFFRKVSGLRSAALSLLSLLPFSVGFAASTYTPTPGSGGTALAHPIGKPPVVTLVSNVLSDWVSQVDHTRVKSTYNVSYSITKTSVKSGGVVYRPDDLYYKWIQGFLRTESLKRGGAAPVITSQGTMYVGVFPYDEGYDNYVAQFLYNYTVTDAWQGYTDSDQMSASTFNGKTDLYGSTVALTGQAASDAIQAAIRRLPDLFRNGTPWVQFLPSEASHDRTVQVEKTRSVALQEWSANYSFANYSYLPFFDTHPPIATLDFPADTVATVQKVQYKFLVGPDSPKTITWLEVFTPTNPALPKEYVSMSWEVPAGATESPAYVIDPIGVDTSDANRTQRKPTVAGKYDVVALPVLLGVDANRDGVIRIATANSSDATSSAAPYRFWTNDDDDFDAINGDDVPAPSGSDDGSAATNTDGDGNVDGLRDLIDFFPVYLDLNTLLTVLPPSTSIKYKLKHANGALNFVYTKLTRADATKYQTQDFGSIFGPSLNQPIASAGTRRISATGVELTSQFLTGVKDNHWGVVLVEAWQPTSQPLVLSVEKADGTVITEVKLHLSISSVESMFRWLNLRDVAGQAITQATNTCEPTNWPDSETNDKMFIFLHGYNVNERDSRGWGSETFKRLYWSGSHAMFTMVSWHGDHSQIPVIGVSPDYWENINYAFMTSQALPGAVASLPGSSKVIVGHSMGNVVVSSAITDHGLRVSHYFMLNAAVALEAYDTAAMNVTAMRHPDWASYETRLWPTEWSNLFPTGDGRRGLTWRDRFGNIANTTNFYSSGEDVLNNNDVTPGDLPAVGGERAWVLQEMVKGTRHIGAVLTFDVQGGWGFNSSWDVPTFVPDHSDAGGYYVDTRRTPAQAAALTDNQLRSQPFFRPFQDTRFVSPTAGSAAAAEYLARADALGGAIPALSFPAGRNPVPLFGQIRNIDLMTKQDGWPRTGGRWFHSDAKNIAYRHNHPLWETWVTLGGLK